MKRLYTLLDSENFVLNAQYFKEGTQPSNAVEELVTENFIKEKFDFETRTFFEGATIEEIQEAQRQNVPNNVRSRQLRLALIYSGFNIDNISNAIGTLEEPTRSVALTEWEYATSFDRDNSLLVSLGQMLGLNDTDIDNLFITANTL